MLTLLRDKVIIGLVLDEGRVEGEVIRKRKKNENVIERNMGYLLRIYFIEF